MEYFIGTMTIACLALVLYHHAGYPLLLRIARRLRDGPLPSLTPRGYANAEHDRRLPHITVIVPAYNEAQFIADKLLNLAVVDYPADRVAVILACDGCTDDTVQVARDTLRHPACLDMTVEIRAFPHNRGKVAVINEVVSGVDHGIVVLSDVSALVSVDALTLVAAHFEDPGTGVVTGAYRLLDPGSEGEAAYWRYQSEIKRSEVALGSILGAHGAFYAFRREHFETLPENTINDDFVLPMRIVARGLRGVYDLRIHALELEHATPGQDHSRRRRIAAGNAQQVLLLWRLLLPKHRGIALAFASGKALRVAMPFLMLMTLAGSVALAPTHPLFAAAAAVQIAAYGAAALPTLVPARRLPRPLAICHYVVSGHVASLVGVLAFLRGCRGSSRWHRDAGPTPRP
jgi:cellulose synthase/poly-beta-1,6-N-acetylglucosamine synthase-like glycosyltransferase